MKVVAGAWRGRKIEAPPGLATRPTSARTREALFSMLASRIGTFEELVVADLFAGTGALGLEALSRGAGSCTFVERDREARARLEANARRLGALDRCRISAADAARFAGGPFDLVFLDPPYGEGLASACLESLARSGSIAPGGWVAAETARAEPLDAPGFTLEAERVHGKARLSLLRPIAVAPPGDVP